jgi:hypothetical protein
MGASLAEGVEVFALLERALAEIDRLAHVDRALHAWLTYAEALSEHQPAPALEARLDAALEASRPVEVDRLNAEAWELQRTVDHHVTALEGVRARCNSISRDLVTESMYHGHPLKDRLLALANQLNDIARGA